MLLKKKFNLPLSASLSSFENIYITHNQILIVHVPTRSNHNMPRDTAPLQTSLSGKEPKHTLSQQNL